MDESRVTCAYEHLRYGFILADFFRDDLLHLRRPGAERVSAWRAI
jgi:hypothetical protein